MSQLVAIITEPLLENIPKLLAQAKEANCYEWRLDYLLSIDIKGIQKIRATISKPLIFTLRTKQHGGLYQGSTENYIALLNELAKLKPDFIDLEDSIKIEVIQQLKQNHPSIKIIRSHHNFDHTPDDLEKILTAMQHPAVSIYKVATTATSSLDNLRLLYFLNKHRRNYRLVVHAMGELGTSSRIAGAIVGNVFSYATLDEEQLPSISCITLNQWIKQYRHHHINAQTEIYALIGDPVQHSIGDIYHNQKYAEHKYNAVYLKFKCTKDMLPQFFKKINGLPFKGFSITTPLKQAVIAYVDQLDDESKHIGAINTLKLCNNQWYAINTDGLGALKAIEKYQTLKKAQVLILGAGASAAAIAYTASKYYKCEITILNRTIKHAQELASTVAGSAYSFDSIDNINASSFPIVINTIPLGVNTHPLTYPTVYQLINNKTVFVNIDYRTHAEQILKTIRSRCQIFITANAMFEQQARLQLDYWEITKPVNRTTNRQTNTALNDN